MVSKMMETDGNDDGAEGKKSKTTTKTKKKSVLDRLEPAKTIRKENSRSPTTFRVHNNYHNNNNYNNNNNNRGGRGGRGTGRGFYDNRDFNNRGRGRARLKASLCNQFPAKKDDATGEVIVQCYGCVIIRVTTTGETRLYRENVERKNYDKVLNVMNEHLKKIGFSVTSSSDDNAGTTAGSAEDSMVDHGEGGGGGGGGGGAPRWNISGMKKFMLFVEGMTLPPPPSPGPGRGLALLLPTKV